MLLEHQTASTTELQGGPRVSPGLPYSEVSEGKDPVVLDDHQKGAHNGQVWFNSRVSVTTEISMGTVTMYGAGMFRELPSETTAERHLARD